MIEWLILGGVALAVASSIGNWSNEKLAEYKAWKSQWRKLRKGCSPSSVRALLGEPKTIQVNGSALIWKYRLGGQIEFDDEKLIAWSEPKVPN